MPLTELAVRALLQVRLGRDLARDLARQSRREGYKIAAALLDRYHGHTYGHLSKVTVRTAPDARAAALWQACETTAAAAARDHAASTAAVGTASQAEPARNLRVERVGPVGIEPTTRGLKVRCSAS